MCNKALSGFKAQGPLYYPRIKPLDILLALSINDLRGLATISLGLLALSGVLRGVFRLIALVLRSVFICSRSRWQSALEFASCSWLD